MNDCKNVSPSDQLIKLSKVKLDYGKIFSTHKHI